MMMYDILSEPVRSLYAKTKVRKASFAILSIASLHSFFFCESIEIISLEKRCIIVQASKTSSEAPLTTKRIRPSEVVVTRLIRLREEVKGNL